MMFDELLDFGRGVGKSGVVDFWSSGDAGGGGQQEAAAARSSSFQRQRLLCKTVIWSLI